MISQPKIALNSSQKDINHPFEFQSSKNHDNLQSQLSGVGFQVEPSVIQMAYKYYYEYLKLFHKNNQLNDSLIQNINQRNLLAQKYSMSKKQIVVDDYVKRKRRQAKDIPRQFVCPIDKCGKGYGSEGSLCHHVRLKHYSFYQSGKYQIYITQLLKNKQVQSSSNKFEHESTDMRVKVQQVE